MRVLLATDGSSDARAAAAFLRQLPLTERGRVRIVSVIERHRAPLEFSGMQAYDDAVAAQGRRVVDEAGAALAAAGAVETAVLEGVPREEIVREARDRDADLVVVGARGLGIVDTFLLGSVSLAVAREDRDSAVVTSFRDEGRSRSRR